MNGWRLLWSGDPPIAPRTKNTRRPYVGEDGKARLAADPKGKAFQTALAKWIALAGEPPATPHDGAVLLVVEVRREVPRSWRSAAKREKALAGKLHPTTKPDLLRLIEPVEDALSGLVWTDDARVVEHQTRKVYAEESGLSIEVWVPEEDA